MQQQNLCFVSQDKMGILIPYLKNYVLQQCKL